ncbi:hypothetical protein NL317_32285, partial [Klebsiella pneumoniae]|nr:hypothetical protein [Klebsiella pneumoniae]
TNAMGVTSYNGTVPLNKGGTGVTSLTGKGIVSVNPGATALVSTACGANSLLSFDASGDVACIAVSAINGTSFVQGGN